MGGENSIEPVTMGQRNLHAQQLWYQYEWTSYYSEKQTGDNVMTFLVISWSKCCTGNKFFGNEAMSTYVWGFVNCVEMICSWRAQVQRPVMVGYKVNHVGTNIFSLWIIFGDEE